MPTQLTVNPGQTTFSEIYKTFSQNMEKQDFSMRLKGNVLYNKGSHELDGQSERAVSSRAQKKSTAVDLIKGSLAREYGEDFALKVMVRLQSGDSPIHLKNDMVLTRGDLHKIQRAVIDEQQAMIPKSSKGYVGSDTNFLKRQIADLHSDPTELRRVVSEKMNGDKLRTLLHGKGITHDQLVEELEQHLIAEWTPENHDGMTSKEIRKETRAIEAQAKRVVEEALSEIYDELGLVPQTNYFTLNAKGIDRLNNLRRQEFDGALTSAEITTLAGFRDNMDGLEDYLNQNPEIAIKLLATPQPSLGELFKTVVNEDGFDANEFLQGLADKAGFDLDKDGLHCGTVRLGELMEDAQQTEGVQPNFAYRVAVRLQGLLGDGNDGRIGGPELVKAANDQFALDLNLTQKVPPPLSQLTEDDMLQIANAMGNPANLKTMVENDRGLMLKLATTSPTELRGHLALLNRDGLSVDECYQRILDTLPGHNAVLDHGNLDLVTVGGALYKVKPGPFGDEGAFGDIFLLNKQGQQDGDNDRIVLKKVRINPNGPPAEQEKAWKMMCNEILLHHHASEGSDKVVKFLDPIRVGDDLYLAMECCDLGSLNKAVFDDGVAKVAKQTNMDPKVELALKLSFMHGMLEAMSEFGDDMGIVHHDNKPGNYFMRSNGDILAGDLGTGSLGPESSAFIGVENPEQHCPEGMTHKLLKDAGPPYGTVTPKADCFAFGIQFAKFVLGHDMFPMSKFPMNQDRETVLAALYEHRDGFFMPPKPDMPDPATKQAMRTYNTDLARYNKMKEQKDLMELAGFTIHDDGGILLFPDDGNPLHTLCNNMLSGDPANRMSATQALKSQAMLALSDPQLQEVLKEMRSITGSIDTGKTVKLKTGPNQEVDTGVYAIPPQQQQRLEELTKKAQLLLGGSEIWDYMMGE